MKGGGGCWDQWKQFSANMAFNCHFFFFKDKYILMLGSKKEFITMQNASIKHVHTFYAAARLWRQTCLL